MLEKLLSYVRKHALLRPGERLGVAVSGGADSVALLRSLLELQGGLGIVLSVVHLDHQVRGEASQADACFVQQLAKEHSLELHFNKADTPAHAIQTRQSIETAARELRYAFFRALLASGKLDKIATAHTLNDQAETVLMRFVRGAGTRGLAGIYPLHNEQRGAVIRPLLAVSREEVESYLRGLQQAWREDATNAALHHTRNRIRHQLLPALRADYNPNLHASLARLADVARDEEAYWSAECARLLPLVLLPGKPTRGGGRAAGAVTSVALNIEALASHPAALQRRLLRAAAESLSIRMDSEQVERALDLAFAGGKSGKVLELNRGWTLRRSFRELAFEPAKLPAKSPGYSYILPVGNSLHIAEAGARLHIGMTSAANLEGYNRPNSLVELKPGAAFTVRNWRAGDRVAAHSGRRKKVKDLLQQMQVPANERACWPVVELEGHVIWVRGLPSPPLGLRTPQGWAKVVISEVEESE